MISDKDLLKISIIAFVIGLALLFVIGQQSLTKRLSVSEIKENMIGEKVSVRGFVESPQIKESLFMSIIDENNSNTKINVVMFNPPKDLTLKAKDLVLVNGEINIYRGELEITATKISKV